MKGEILLHRASCDSRFDLPQALGKLVKLLLIDTVEYPAHWAERQVLEAWFGPLLQTLPPQVCPAAVAASSPQLLSRSLEADAVIITGSAQDAWSEDPPVLALCATLRELAARNMPVLGICFGHQLLARALGGTVGRNPAGWETGNVTIRLTPQGLACPFLAGLGPEPDVLQSHQDAVLSLPPGGVLLAGNACTPVQAFQSRPGGRQFGLQFHPEFTQERLRENWAERRERLRGTTGFDLDAALDHARATPHTAGLFRKFMEYASSPG